MRILRCALEAVADHAREGAPEECCGILLASDCEPVTVREALRAENAETDQPEQRYSLGHEAHLRAVALEAEGGVEIVGYYHSHPQGTAAPSPRDAEEAAEDVTYLIVGLGAGPAEWAAWRREGDHLVRERLEVVDV